MQGHSYLPNRDIQKVRQILMLFWLQINKPQTPIQPSIHTNIDLIFLLETYILLE